MKPALLDRTERQLAIRAKIDVLQDLMTGAVDCGTMEQTVWDGASEKGSDQCEHFFGDGVYGRLLTIPAGTCVIGRIHLKSRICVILNGRCSFCDEFVRRTVEGPFVGKFKAGTKTAVFAHTDTTWIAFIGTDMTDPLKIVDEWSTMTREDYDDYVRGKA